MISGFCASVRAKATRCCCPPESWSARIYALSRIPTLSRLSSACILSSFLNTPSRTLQKGISGTFAINTLRITVVRVTRLNDWKIIPIFLRKVRSSFPFKFLTSNPSTVRVPDVMSCIRLIVRSNVDFPAPERPMIATNSPCSIFKLTLSSPTTPFGYTFDTSLNSIINLNQTFLSPAVFMVCVFYRCILIERLPQSRFPGSAAALLLPVILPVIISLLLSTPCQTFQ